jgi:uncharacterized protein YkwD
MLRALVVSFAMLAVFSGIGAAQATPPAGEGPDNVRGEVHSQQPTPNQPPAPKSNLAVGSHSGEDSAAENELLDAINKSRELAGSPALRVEESLREAARMHARRMVASGLLEHRLAGEPSLLERIAAVIAADRAAPDSALKIDRAGENIANASCAPGANDVLMGSAPHRKNRLDRGFNVAGVAAIWSKGRLYVVEDFAHEVPSYSAQQSGQLVGHAVDQVRQDEGLPDLVQLTPPNLDQAACSLARESRPNARLLATSYSNRRIVTYTQSRPEVLPPGALRLLRDPGVRQFAVGSCYARNAAYPTGMYWVAILLY